MIRCFFLASWVVVLAAARVPAQSQQFINPTNGHLYMLSDHPLTLHEARCWAGLQGGYLVAINDAAEQAFINANFSGYLIGWIGLSDEVTEGTFVWDSGEALTFTNWCPGEPNNFYLEDYVEMSEFCVSGSPRWNDVNPYSLSGAIIEIPLPYVPPAGPGSHNSLDAALIINDQGCVGVGPFIADVNAGSPLVLDWYGPPNELTLLFTGPPAPVSVSVGCVGWIDIGTPPFYPDITPVFPAYLQPLFALDWNGRARQTFTIPSNMPLGPFITVQGLIPQPVGAPCSVKLTAAFTIVVN